MKRFSILSLLVACSIASATMYSNKANAGVVIAFNGYHDDNPTLSYLGLAVMIAAVPVGIKASAASGPLLGALAAVGTFYLNDVATSPKVDDSIQALFPKITSRDTRSQIAEAISRKANQVPGELVHFTRTKKKSKFVQVYTIKHFKLDRGEAASVLSSDPGLSQEDLDAYVDKLSN